MQSYDENEVIGVGVIEPDVRVDALCFVTESDRKQYSEFELRHLEVVLMVQHDEMRHLEEEIDKELRVHREAERYEGIDEYFDFFLHAEQVRICYHAVLRCLRMAVRHERELVRAGFWKCSAKMNYHDMVSKFDRKLGVIRRLAQDVGILVDYY